jgi:hypothetical protein
MVQRRARRAMSLFDAEPFWLIPDSWLRGGFGAIQLKRKEIRRANKSPTPLMVSER